MRVMKSTLDRYRKEVDDQAELARAYVSRALDEYFRQNPNASTADGRRFAIALLEAALPNFTDAAGTLAVDFFDEMMEAEGIEVDSQLYDTTDYSVIEEKVRYFADKLNEHDEAAFKKQVVDATHYFVKRSAYDNMVMNCDANNVRYARVPSGFETCAFCFMLASRGFVYLSEAKARGEHAYHDNCDCCIVPGAKGRTRIDGYDPGTMYRNWASCRRAIGGSKEIMREWLALSDDERREWIVRHDSESKAYNRFMQDRVMAEVRTRDWHWLYTGNPPHYKILEGSKPSEDERETAKRLSLFGFQSFFRPTRAAEGKRTSDVFFGNGESGDRWEFKKPTGDGRWTVFHQLEEAAGQSKKVVIDISVLEKPESGQRWNRKSIEDEVIDQISRVFKVPKGSQKGQPWVFEEVILISDDRTYCRRIVNKEGS